MALISIRLETGLAPGFTAGQMYRMRPPYAARDAATCGHLMRAVNVNLEVNLQALQDKVQSGEPRPGAIFWSK